MKLCLIFNKQTLERKVVQLRLGSLITYRWDIVALSFLLYIFEFSTKNILCIKKTKRSAVYAVNSLHWL